MTAQLYRLKGRRSTLRSQYPATRYWETRSRTPAGFVVTVTRAAIPRVDEPNAPPSHPTEVAEHRPSADALMLLLKPGTARHYCRIAGVMGAVGDRAAHALGARPLRNSRRDKGVGLTGRSVSRGASRHARRRL